LLPSNSFPSRAVMKFEKPELAAGAIFAMVITAAVTRKSRRMVCCMITKVEL